MKVMCALLAMGLLIPFDLFSQEEIRLTRIKEAIGSIQKSINAPVAARQARYLKELAALEKTISAKGNLDEVLQVKNEREAWEKNQPSPKIDPKNNKVTLELRKLRYYFDQDTTKLKMEQKSKVSAQNRRFIVDLRKLEASLTKEGNIEAALATRKVKEELMAGRLATAPKEEAESKVDFEDWLETVRFVVPSGYAFRVSDSDVYLTPPGEAEKLIARAEVKKKSQTIMWELGNGVERSIEVSKDRKSAELTADSQETLTIEKIPKD